MASAQSGSPAQPAHSHHRKPVRPGCSKSTSRIATSAGCSVLVAIFTTSAPAFSAPGHHRLRPQEGWSGVKIVQERRSQPASLSLPRCRQDHGRAKLRRRWEGDLHINGGRRGHQFRSKFGPMRISRGAAAALLKTPDRQDRRLLQLHDRATSGGFGKASTRTSTASTADFPAAARNLRPYGWFHNICTAQVDSTLFLAHKRGESTSSRARREWDR